MSYRTGVFINGQGVLVQWVDTGLEWNAPRARDEPDDNMVVGPWVHQKEAGQPTCWHRTFQPPRAFVPNPHCT